VTWEYSGDPADSPKDEVRFLIQDVDDDPDKQEMQDEEIDYLLAAAGNAADAATAAARVLAARYAGKVSKAVGDLRLELSDKTKNYRELATFLAKGGGVAGVAARPVPYAGGISIADKQRQEDDADRVEPGFVVGEDSLERREERATGWGD